MSVREKFLARLINEPGEFGISEAKFVYTSKLFTTRAVRLRCQYTCQHTRQSDFVPPHSPNMTETRELLDEYKYGLMLRLEAPQDIDDAGELWHAFTDHALDIEKQCLLNGYPRAFMLAVGNCLYQQRDDDRMRPCEFPCKSRPTLEALGIELKETFEMLTWHCYIHREEGDPFQMFALLLLE